MYWNWDQEKNELAKKKNWLDHHFVAAVTKTALIYLTVLISFCIIHLFSKCFFWSMNKSFLSYKSNFSSSANIHFLPWTLIEYFIRFNNWVKLIKIYMYVVLHWTFCNCIKKLKNGCLEKYFSDDRRKVLRDARKQFATESAKTKTSPQYNVDQLLDKVM